MLPCWTTMLAFDRRLDVGFDAAFVEIRADSLARQKFEQARPSLRRDVGRQCSP